VRAMIVLGSGGHTKEMIRLVDLLGPDYEYSYLACADDELSPQKIKTTGAVYRVIRPRLLNIGVLTIGLRTLWAAGQAFVALLHARPHAIISAGPGIAVPACILAKLLGIKVIYIETGSRVFALSTSGKILSHFADLFFVQWEELLASYPEAIYAGRLL
jgi:beta-1,4-N-acetylglucosaminyltransferase